MVLQSNEGADGNDEIEAGGNIAESEYDGEVAAEVLDEHGGGPGRERTKTITVMLGKSSYGTARSGLSHLFTECEVDKYFCDL